jgi:hypothetical protein
MRMLALTIAVAGVVTFTGVADASAALPRDTDKSAPQKIADSTAWCRRQARDADEQGWRRNHGR